MRTILNFEIASEVGSGAPPPPAVADAVAPEGHSLIEAEPAQLFRSVTAAPASGQPGRWARSIAVAVALHVVLVAGFASAGMMVHTPEASPEPEVVFYSFPPPPPPPPAPSGVKAQPTPKVQARRVPRKDPVIPQQVKRVEEKAPVEPEPVEAQEDPPQTADTAPVEGAVAGGVVGGVAGGVAGGVVGGSVGGLVGATTPGPLKLSEVLRAPKVLQSVKPDYPRSAKLAGVEGLVVVQIVIGVDGRVERDSTRVVKSVPGLDGAAVAAVSQYRFTPALGRDGKPARVIVNLPLQFNLR